MDLTALLRRFEIASFAEREGLADSVAGSLDGQDRRALVAGLAHAKLPVRLGVIAILGRSGDAAMIAPLLAHARTRPGDDRIFALRALCGLARPGDETLQAAAGEFSASTDPFTQAQAQALLTMLGVTPPTLTAPPLAPRPVVAIDTSILVGNLLAPDRALRAHAIGVALARENDGDTLLLQALFAATSDGPRLDLVATLEGLPGERFARAADVALAQGNGDAVALVARALIRQAGQFSQATRIDLRAGLEGARRRLSLSPLARAALDDALSDVAEADLPSDLWDELVDADADRLASQVDRWLHLSVADLALRAPVLIAAAKNRFDRWAIVSAALDLAIPALRPTVRADLRDTCRHAVDLISPNTPSGIVAALAQVLAQVAEPGSPLPVPLFTAADHLADGEILRELCLLCLRLASEEAALRLLDLAKDPLPEVAAEAQAAIPQFCSPYAKITLDGPAPRVVASYRNTRNKELATSEQRLFDPDTNEDYALDPVGYPLPVKDLAHGACCCCPRPRLLVRHPTEGLRCPSTLTAYLLDKGRLVPAADHPLGRCSRCESIAARVREGMHIVCPDCGAGRPSAGVDSGGNPASSGEGPAHPAEVHEERPRPPTREELLLVAPPIRHAMAANVFIVADGRTSGWTGSGIIVAREGTHVAILTNRHMVENAEAREIPNLRALSLGGEEAPLTLLWRAPGGVDLALVEARFENQEAIDVMALGHGACLVGSPLFAIGNPLGLAWSYTSGTLSAIRHWETADRLPTQLIQTDVPTAPGSSGGGLFHQEGHLVGIISFGKQGEHGAPAHFAISVPTIRETALRETLQWRGRSLLT